MNAIRGVQYVHCVMHKCIMVKAGGDENHRKHVQDTEILRNQGKIGGTKDFPEIGGNTKIEGENFKFMGDE